MKQGIYVQSAIPKYPIGMRYPKDDRVFHYAKAGTALLGCWGAYSYAPFPESAVAAASSAIGAKTVTCTAQETVTVNQFAGGYMMHYVTGIYCHRIKSNTAAEAGSPFVVTLEDVLLEAVTSGATKLTLYPGLFNDMRRYVLGTAYGTHIGVPLIAITIDYYFWLQTWGPAIVVGSDNVGAGANERELYFAQDGAILFAGHGSLASPAPPKAGFFWPSGWDGETGHDAIDGMIPVWLQCIP